jgi:hypothetical protein
VTAKETGADIAPIGNSPVIILVRPQLADNIGAMSAPVSLAVTARRASPARLA